MTHATWPDGADMLARASRHWGCMMAFGIISLMEVTLAIRTRSAGRRIEDRELHPV